MKADKDTVARMLKTARGQIDGVLNLIEQDRYCIDISNQIQAAQALLGKANAEVLKAQVHSCVRKRAGYRRCRPETGRDLPDSGKAGKR